MKKLTVREYAIEKRISETAVRKQIKQNRLRTTHEMLNNRKTILILVDEGSEHVYDQTKPDKPNQTEPGFESVYDAEIVNDSPGYNIVSIEKESFDSLIQNFKVMSDDRANVLEKSLESTQTEFFELKAKYTQLEEKHQQQLIELIQSQVEMKIKELKISELEAKLKGQQEKIHTQEFENKELKEQIDKLKFANKAIEEKLQPLQEQMTKLETENNTFKEELKQKTKGIWGLFK